MSDSLTWPPLSTHWQGSNEEKSKLGGWGWVGVALKMVTSLPAPASSIGAGQSRYASPAEVLDLAF
jgi:hypothetical protein